MARLPARFDDRSLLLWLLAGVAAVGLAVWDYQPRATREVEQAADVVDFDVLEGQLRGDAGRDALP